MRTFMVRRLRVRQTPKFLFAALISGLLGFCACLMDSTTLHAHEFGEPSGIKIVIIGATARTANYMIPQALWRGHEVVAVARRPYRVRHKPHPRLTIVKGDVYEQASIEAALSGDGDEIVISVYGPRVDPTIEIPAFEYCNTPALGSSFSVHVFSPSTTAVSVGKLSSR